jgi:hypothetical protein
MNRQLALRRFREHDPTGEFLFTPEGYAPDEDDGDEGELLQGKLL